MCGYKKKGRATNFFEPSTPGFATLLETNHKELYFCAGQESVQQPDPEHVPAGARQRRSQARHHAHALRRRAQDHTRGNNTQVRVFISVPDPPDPHVFGPPGSGSISQRHVSGSGSFHHQAKIGRKPSDSSCFVTAFGLFIFEK